MLSFKPIVIITLILCLLFINTVKADKSMLKNKPYFTLRLETKNTHYEAKINGVSILRDIANGNMLHTEIPVNHFMRSGTNSISLNIFPKRDSGFDTSTISLRLYVNTDEAPESEKKLIANIVFTGEEYAKFSGIESSMPAMHLDSTDKFKRSNNGDVVIHSAVIEPATIMPDALKISQIIELQTPFPEWGFLSGEKLDFPLSYAEYLKDKAAWNEQIIGPLYQEYKKIHDLLASNDLDKVLSLFKERNREMDIALYYPEGTYDKKIRDSFSSDLKHLKLVLRAYSKAGPLISDDKKLFKLGNVGMIYFTNDNESSFTNYDIWFYKKDGKWIISR